MNLFFIVLLFLLDIVEIINCQKVVDCSSAKASVDCSRNGGRLVVHTDAFLNESNFRKFAGIYLTFKGSEISQESILHAKFDFDAKQLIYTLPFTKGIPWNLTNTLSNMAILNTTLFMEVIWPVGDNDTSYTWDIQTNCGFLTQRTVTSNPIVVLSDDTIVDHGIQLELSSHAGVDQPIYEGEKVKFLLQFPVTMNANTEDCGIIPSFEIDSVLSSITENDYSQKACYFFRNGKEQERCSVNGSVISEVPTNFEFNNTEKMFQVEWTAFVFRSSSDLTVFCRVKVQPVDPNILKVDEIGDMYYQVFSNSYNIRSVLSTTVTMDTRKGKEICMSPTYYGMFLGITFGVILMLFICMIYLGSRVIAQKNSNASDNLPQMTVAVEPAAVQRPKLVGNPRNLA